MSRVATELRLLNATSTGESLRFESVQEDFAAFDELPPDIRWRVANSNTKLASSAFVEHARWAMRQRLGALPTTMRISEYERNELAVFAGEYRGRYAMVLPHIAADASIQRYGARGPSEHPPRVSKGRR